MRTFCLLLILVNVLYFIWSQLIDVQVSALDRAPINAAKPVQRIVLAEEARSVDEVTVAEDDIRAVEPPSVEPLVRPQTGSATDLTSADTLSCSSVGPFVDLSQAAQAQAALRTAGFQPRQRLEQGELWVGYWVSVPNLATRQAADEAIRTLTGNGITDVYLMPGPERGSVLSLGVFSDLVRAQRRADEVRALGLSPQIEDRKRAGSVYWIDVDLKQPGELIDTSLFQTDPGKITRLEMHPCPAAG